MTVFFSYAFVTGLQMYAKYETCDPTKAGIIAKPDQVNCTSTPSASTISHNEATKRCDQNCARIWIYILAFISIHSARHRHANLTQEGNYTIHCFSFFFGFLFADISLVCIGSWPCHTRSIRPVHIGRYGSRPIDHFVQFEYNVGHNLWRFPQITVSFS